MLGLGLFNGNRNSNSLAHLFDHHSNTHICCESCGSVRNSEKFIYPIYRNIKWNLRIMVNPCGRHKIDIEQHLISNNNDTL